MKAKKALALVELLKRKEDVLSDNQIDQGIILWNSSFLMSEFRKRQIKKKILQTAQF